MQTAVLKRPLVLRIVATIRGKGGGVLVFAARAGGLADDARPETHGDMGDQ